MNHYHHFINNIKQDLNIINKYIDFISILEIK